MALAKDERRKRLAEWLLLSDEQRAVLGFPATRAAFAKVLEVNDKTLQRDCEDPDFVAQLEARRAAHQQRTGVVPTDTAAAALSAVVSAGDVSVESLDALVPRALSRLVTMSEGGDREATKTLLSLPHVKAWMDEQVRAAEADYSTQTPAEMAADVLALFDDATLAPLLLARGWAPRVPPVSSERSEPTAASEPATSSAAQPQAAAAAAATADRGMPGSSKNRRAAASSAESTTDLL